VAAADLALEAYRATRDDAWLDRAFAGVEAASKLAGCQNRVGWLRANAHLERARAKLARGEDPRGDLEAVKKLGGGEPSHVPDNGPWLRVLAAADDLLKHR
jgi:hypothetical protein